MKEAIAMAVLRLALRWLVRRVERHRARCEATEATALEERIRELLAAEEP